MPKRKRPKTGGIERSAPTRNVPYSRRRKRPESPPVFRKRSERQKQAGRQPTHAANAAGKGSAHSAKHAGAAANRYVPSGSAGTCSGRKARRRSALRKEPFYKTYRPRKFPPPHLARLIGTTVSGRQPSHLRWNSKTFRYRLSSYDPTDPCSPNTLWQI